MKKLPRGKSWQNRVFPNKRKTSKPYPWNPGTHKTQSVVPDDPRLAQKLGINPNEKVLVFAGGAGDWANALAQFCKVHYTDVSHAMTRFVETQKKGGIKSFRSRPAELLIRRPNLYDWSFSYEPIPLGDRIELVLVRSLLNRKGCKIAEGSVLGHTPLFISHMHSVARIYGAKVSSSITTVREAGGRMRSVAVSTLETNQPARKRAQTDLAVFELLNSLAKRKKSISKAEACSKLHVTEKELEKSLKRIDQLEKLSTGRAFHGFSTRAENQKQYLHD